jgi:hypothetical protein
MPVLTGAFRTSPLRPMECPQLPASFLPHAIQQVPPMLQNHGTRDGIHHARRVTLSDWQEI